MRPNPTPECLPVELGGCPSCGRFAQVVFGGGCDNPGCPGPPPAFAPVAAVRFDRVGTQRGVPGPGCHVEPCRVCRIPTVWPNASPVVALCTPDWLAARTPEPTRAWLARVGRPEPVELNGLGINEDRTQRWTRVRMADEPRRAPRPLYGSRSVA